MNRFSVTIRKDSGADYVPQLVTFGNCSEVSASDLLAAVIIGAGVASIDAIATANAFRTQSGAKTFASYGWRHPNGASIEIRKVRA